MNFLDRFKKIVDEQPDNVAIVDFGGARSTTYQELADWSSRVAAKLLEAGEAAGRTVLVCMDRRMEYVAAEIGIMMAGGAYVPLLPEYPSERIDYIREDCGAVCTIDAGWMEDIGQYEPAGKYTAADKDRAMIIYTSGSTGRPKGIVHSHESLYEGVKRVASTLGFGKEERLAAAAPLSFVVSLMEYYAVLSSGGCTHMLSEEVRRDVRMLEAYYEQKEITCGFISPQMLRYFKNQGKALKTVVTGSERVSMLSGDGYVLYNFYGCSESALLISAFQVEEPVENTPIGKPVQGVEMFLLDEQGREVPDGEEGEICVLGVLGECYLNMEEQSARIFQRQEDGRILLHTGDMGRKLPDGNYVYVNRRDWMVKINGQRVETGEIEIRMAAAPGVKNAAVKAFEDENGQNYLCGFYVAGEEIVPEDIRACLKEALPDYMIPRFFKRMEELPKNVNGKLDRTALLPPGISEYKGAYREPENEMQRRICEAFAEILHCGKTGIGDDFFQLGGDSINVLKLVECLADFLLTPGMVLQGRTPEKIALLLQEKMETIDSGERTGALDNLREYAGERKEWPLTDSQMGVYLECINDPEGTMYNIPMSCELPEHIDMVRFREAVKAAVAMHPTFGVKIMQKEGMPLMELCPEFLNVNVRECTARDMKGAEKDFVRPFAIGEEPLYRMALYRMADGSEKNRIYFFFDVHHLIFDGTSVNVFLEEISLLYKGEEPKPEEISLMDVAVYEETVKGTPEYQAAREYFKEKLGDGETGEVLLKDYRMKSAGTRSGSVRMSLGEALSVMEVEQFTRQRGISENTLFLGAFAYALGKYTGENRSLFCTVNNGRHRPGLAESVGMFVRTLPICQSFEEDLPVEVFLQEFQRDFYETMEHDVISFAELARDYGIASDILFVYQGEMLKGLSFNGKRYPAQPLSTGQVQADISVMVMKGQGGYEISLDYRRDLYREETAKGLSRMLAQVLRGMLSCRSLNQISLVSESDIQLLDSFHGPEVSFDRTKTVVDLFREQAGHTPEAAAVIYLDRIYTYAQTDDITDRLAAYIAGLGIGREQTVSVLIPRCEYMVLASLGILKAGAAYQPLDSTYPKERLSFMIQDADAQLLIAEEELLYLVEGYQGKILLTKDIPGLPEAGRTHGESAAAGIPCPPAPEDLFILLYTSGSTGVPKGCMLEHGNLMAFCQWYREYYDLQPGNRVAAYASYGFDAHMMDIYPALTAGASVCIIDQSIRLDLNELNHYFVKQGVTHAFMTTQIGRAFAASVQCGSLKHLSMGGEALTPFTPAGDTKYYNVYGPTECTILTTAYCLDRYEEDVPIGKALSNLKLYVVDSCGRRVPAGVPGELWITGYQVSRGYLNRPEKTAEAYSENPFSDAEGYRRAYHTGDIVRFLPDGNIQFIGRRDGQVKIRGFRIELTEVEEIIRKFPGILDATVVAFDESGGGKYIAAYVVAGEQVDIEALNAFIEESKPPYMVPAVTMQIEKIPLNQNQKVDRKALPMPQREKEELTEPVGAMQQKIFDCVAEVIGHREFGATTDIYRAGLTSIGAVRLNALLSTAFEGVVVRNKDLKEYNTVEKLEKLLLERGEREIFAIQDAYPLTQTQNGIFVECAANPGSTIYNIPFLFRLDEKVELSRLKKAAEEAVAAHPYIKTTLFMDEKGDIWQKRNDDAPFEVEIKEHLCREELVRPYRLLDGRLFCIELYETEEGNYLFLEFHHIISDGTSCGIFIRDMNAAYGGGKLTAETFSGFEAALVEQKAMQGEEYSRAKEYYDSVFSGCDTDFLPVRDKREAASEDHAGTMQKPSGKQSSVGLYSRNIEVDMDAIRGFCAEKQITMNTLFTAAFGFVTGRYVYKDEAVFTTIYNGRNDSRLSSVISMLVKTLPVYCNLDGEQEIGHYLRETGEQLLNSMNADIYSFAEISRAYGIKADILFAFQGDDFRFEEIAGEKAVLEELRLDTAKAPLSVDVAVNGKEICYQAEYRSDLYEESTIAGLVDALAVVVEEFCNQKFLKEVSMVSREARRELDGYNETDYPVEQVTANVLFERQAALHPDKIAVIAGGETRTFRELNENANRIANYLLDIGLKTDGMVGVMMPRTADVYAVRQGIMKAGGAFVPIDPEYPDERISYILEDSGAAYVIMPKELISQRSRLVDRLTAKALSLEELLAEGGDIRNPRVNIRPENLCYCIYTSGSTGKPKGVMIEHHNLVNYVDDNPFNVEAQSYVHNAAVSLAFAAITFDVSILEECIPLYHGITVCMATEEEIHNPLALSELILAHGVNMMTCTPSFLTNIIDMPEMREALSQIKVFNVGAEAFPDALYGKIMALGTTPCVFNGYGPTETTIGCAFEQVTGEKITIGKPMANTKMMIIDKYRNLLPAGAPGELLIIGNGVGRGYVGKPEMTADKFIAFEGRRAYRSGDLARWNHHGKVEFMGRMDNQVKLRGLRVELDEIENVMNRYPAVKSSVVLVKEKDGDQFLCGYFVAERQVDYQNLTCFMQKYLTPYMVPGVLMQLPELPLTNNGKVDKRALPEPDYTLEKKNYVEPRTELQRRLCEIFAMALGVDKIGIEDDFFENGGTSLSASKVAMKCMSAGIGVSYADLFEYKTPLALERYLTGDSSQNGQEHQDERREEDGQTGGQDVQGRNARRDTGEGIPAGEPESDSPGRILARNTAEHVDEIMPSDIGNVLLTGATGFLGAHILKTMIETTDNTIYCLLRQGNAPSLEKRLKSMLVYYFSNPYEELFGNRIVVIEGDITDADKMEALKQYDFDRVINCAACVKHFSADDTLERVNYQGVLHLIRLCSETGRELIQISTVSVAGENVGQKFPAEKKIYENELDFGQCINNKYIDTKFRAEKAVLEAVGEGMRGRVIRVGNLMSRVSDGEFQINSVTNGFMRTLRGYVALGKFPVSLLDTPAEFSPIDSTAEAIVKIAGARGDFSVFHAYSSYVIQMADVVEQMNSLGIAIETVSDEEFEMSLQKALEDERKNELISGLIAYLPGAQETGGAYIDADNGFTTKILYRLGFKWPMPDKDYLRNALKALETLGFFDGKI